MISIALLTALAAPPTTEVRVLCASSLREAFDAIAREVEKSAPEVRIRISSAGSQALRVQLEHGAVADVIATADEATMDALVSSGRVVRGDVHRFAANRLIVVLGHSVQLSSFAQLPDVRRIVLAAGQVPVGRYSEQLLDNARKTLGADFKRRVLARVVSRELNVRQVLAKVALGEADAGIVYESDVHTEAGAKVQTLAIPLELNVVAHYPIAVIADSKRRELATAFVEHVRSPAGAAVLRRFGFVVDVSGSKP